MRNILRSHGPARQPRVTVVVNHPIQYFSPLFDELSKRGVVSLSVLYGNDAGLRSTFDPGFGKEVQWNVDLIGGHNVQFIRDSQRRSVRTIVHTWARALKTLSRSDVVVIHGYAAPEAIFAILVCLVARVPYLLRTDTSVQKERSIADARGWWVRLVSRRAAGALATGTRNAAVHRGSGVSRIFPAPFSVDVARFANGIDAERRRDTRARLGIPAGRYVVIFLGKLVSGKRPQDFIEGVDLASELVHGLLIGDGPLRETLLNKTQRDKFTFLGFHNQQELPSLLSAGDVIVLPSSYEAWGLSVNEGLACGLVPVVSDAVGCAPDIVEGVGCVFPTGDTRALARAIDAACRIRESARFAAARDVFLENYSIPSTAAAYEQAIAEVVRIRPGRNIIDR